MVSNQVTVGFAAALPSTLGADRDPQPGVADVAVLQRVATGRRRARPSSSTGGPGSAARVAAAGHGSWPPGRSRDVFEIAGLAPNTAYDVTVRAVNASGAGEAGRASGRTEAVPAAVNPPSQPRITGGSAGNHRVTVRWAAPLRTGGARIDRYQVHRRGANKIVGASVRSAHLWRTGQRPDVHPVRPGAQPGRVRRLVTRGAAEAAPVGLAGWLGNCYSPVRRVTGGVPPVARRSLAPRKGARGRNAYGVPASSSSWGAGRGASKALAGVGGQDLRQIRDESRGQAQDEDREPRETGPGLEQQRPPADLGEQRDEQGEQQDERQPAQGAARPAGQRGGGVGAGRGAQAGSWVGSRVCSQNPWTAASRMHWSVCRGARCEVML